MAVELRPFRPGDMDALYHICLVTGDAGQDASALHNDPKLLGHIYAANYGALEPDHAFVAEDEDGVAGYIVGTHDTIGFSQKLEEAWWPALRAQYQNRDGLTELDRRMVATILRPQQSPSVLLAPFPAHIHMNLLPRLRGQKIGTRLLTLWIEQARRAGVRGIHLGASPTNAGGIAFWSRSGFIQQDAPGPAIWFGMTL